MERSALEQPLDIFAERTALAVAHPGHELCVHGWMQRARPVVLVLTDGSGGKGSSRLASTERVLQQTGARPGCLFGRFPDRQMYHEVLAGNTQLFLNLAAELAVEFVRNQIEIVVGDAAEGAILTHDLWRGVVNRAVVMARQSLGRPLLSLEFPLEESQAIPGAASATKYTLRLSDSELREKLTAARSYRELSHEIERAIAARGEEGLRCETFFLAQICQADTDLSVSPRYELHGEQQVAAGVYSQVVRYQQHVLPILRALLSDCRKTEVERQCQEAA
jgi:hypothetical protein